MVYKIISPAEYTRFDLEIKLNACAKNGLSDT